MERTENKKSFKMLWHFMVRSLVMFRSAFIKTWVQGKWKGLQTRHLAEKVEDKNQWHFYTKHL